jgi:hypothetical protein
MPVHTVKSRAHDPAQTRRAEFQPAEKAAFNLLVVVPDGAQLRPLFIAQRRTFKPR